MSQVTKNARRPRLVGLGLAVGAVALAWAALASGDDADAVVRGLKEVEASPHKAAATELVARARDATSRAEKLRRAGDESHAKLADGLARRWADAAVDVVRAVEAEERAKAKRLAAADAGASADRERALLEEGVAQKGRLRAQIEATTHGERAARTSAAASDAGAAAPAASGDGGAAKRAPKGNGR